MDNGSSSRQTAGGTRSKVLVTFTDHARGPDRPAQDIVIAIFRCSDYIQAHLLVGLLAERGIETFLQGAHLQGGLGELPAMGHLVIMVDESDRSAARLVLDAYERGELELGDDHDGADSEP